MNALEFFLREHAGVHSAAVVLSEFTQARLLVGLDEGQWRARPQGLNSIAWIVWHITRVEDGCVGLMVFGQEQVLDAAWWKRLRLDPERAYQSRAEVDELTSTVDLEGLRDYRDATGRRTRELAALAWPDRWEEGFTEADLRRGVAAATAEEEESYLIGVSREKLLHWWGIHHSHHHLGQVATLRALLHRDRGRRAP